MPIRRGLGLLAAAGLLVAGIAAANPPSAEADVAAVPPAELNSGVTRAGTAVPIDMALTYGGSRRAEIRAPGSTYIKVHFGSFKLAHGDYVTVASPDRREVHTYFGEDARGSAFTKHGGSGFAAMSVDGDTAIVTLHATGSRNPARLGVRINQYFRGYDTAETAAHNPGTLSVCGTDARRDVACYQTSHPTEYTRANAVARQLLNGIGHCTAWRVGNTNRMLTNQHCMENASDLRASEFQFDYQCATCGGNNPRTGTKVSGLELIKISGLNQLDYALFSVNNFDRVQSFGTLYLETRESIAGERIYIPGHGDVKPKRLSLFEDSQGGATCKIDTVSAGVNTGYRCDTSGGNSGSPVLAASSHKVIALHHLGGCPNWGTRIKLVYDQIRTDIDNTPR
ncbi:trypsin-like serine peptidase [Actinosynnema sp. ALI-1.44]|uniref:trypsin-like serine peptidase n=1 Tax=Actinosynnema sp. ALI-1.44 TaxID=1933779 RepID=UPI000A0435F0|nr:serine protease [Actinosynnema sp. ALI-1.44]